MNSSAVLSLVLNKHGSSPLHQQLQEQIETLIDKGRLLANDRLPSSRDLSVSLGVSRTTVLTVLNNMIAEGSLVSQPKRGVFVSSLTQVSNANTYKPNTTQTEQANIELESFDSGADTSVFPNRLWANSMKSAWLNPDQMLMQGKREHGLPDLQYQICKYLKQLRGLECEPAQIILTAGNRDAMSILSHALQQLTQATAHLEQACFPQIPAVFEWLSIKKKSLVLDDFGARTPTKTSCGFAVLTPSRQYPLGVSMSSMRKQEWIAFLLHQKIMPSMLLKMTTTMNLFINKKVLSL